mgnify:CR=1 FL=1
MKNFRNYLQLHLNILLFSLTSVFSKLASIQYNKNGPTSICIPVPDDRQLRNLRNRLATGHQKILTVHRLCQQKCLSSMVTDLGSRNFS